jgi:hypothetical protein
VSHLSKRFFLLLVAVAVALPAWAQRGALTVSRNLDQLTARAGVIVRGTVTGVKVEKHPEFNALNTIVITLQVKETLKGEAGETFTFRQYIWDIRDRHDAAGYRKGQEYLLLLLTPNQHGLTSPAGMGQGRFRITRDRSGKELALNGQSNFKLFDGLGAQLAKKGITLSPKSAGLVSKHRLGPIEAGELVGLIRELDRGSN